MDKYSRLKLSLSFTMDDNDNENTIEDESNNNNSNYKKKEEKMVPSGLEGPFRLGEWRRSMSILPSYF